METLLRDLRHAGRALRRAPAFTASLVLGLAAGIGVGLPMLGLVRAGLLRPRAYSEQALLDAVRQSDWRTGWTDLARTPSSVQDGGLRALLLILLGVVALVVLVTLLNAAILLLVRTAGRRQEITMRVVLGAGRRRLAGQLLTEGALLCALAGGLGVLLGAAGVLGLRLFRPDGVPSLLAPVMDGWVVLGSVGLPAALTLLVGLAPVLLAFRRDPGRGLGAAGRVTSARGEGQLRNGLVIAAIASSLVLLVGAGLLVRGSASKEDSVGAGLDPRDTYVASVQLAGAADASPAARAAAYASLLERVRAVPGVVDTSVASHGALLGLGTEDLVHTFFGEPGRPGVVTRAHYHAVGPAFFRSVGAAVSEGREFTAADDADADGVAVINQTYASWTFRGIEPIGKRVQLGGSSLDGRWYTIVGVVEDIRPQGIGTAEMPEPALYLSALQHPPRSATLTVRMEHGADPAPALLAAGSAGLVEPEAEVRALAAVLDEFLAPLRWFGLLFAGLAGVGLILSAAGLYGVMSYSVERRTREIGVRMAVGAQPRDVVRMILRESLRVARTGALVGLAGAVCLARLLQYLYEGVRPLDPVVYSGVALLLVATALLAAHRPARRAALVDPTVSLRAE